MENKCDVALHASSGPESVGGKHMPYFNSIGRNEIPTRAFWVNQARQVQMWHTTGKAIIVFGNANMNLHSEHAKAQLASMGISDAISPFVNNKVPFSTYDKGSTVINGCFITGEV
jgi:hypothetical protein